MEPVEEGLPSGGILRIARRVGFYRHDRRLLIDGKGILRVLLVMEDGGYGARGVFASCRTRGHPLSQRRVARGHRNDDERNTELRAELSEHVPLPAVKGRAIYNRHKAAGG